MDKKELIKLIKDCDSKSLNKSAIEIIKKCEDDLDAKYNDSTHKKLENYLELINLVLNNYDKLDDENLKELFKNFDTREKLKDELQNQKVLIEDLFVTLNNEKQKIKDVAFKELKDELELSNDRIKNRKKSIKFFWINILVSLLSFFSTAVVYSFKSLPVSIAYTVILSCVNFYFIFTYISIKVKSINKDRNVFDYWQPMCYIVWSLFIEFICIMSLYDVVLIEKNFVFYVSLILNVSVITFGIGSAIKSLKLTNGTFNILALALSVSLLLFILEESFGSYMPIPSYLINILLVITFLIWMASIIKNCLIIQNANKNAMSYLAVFFEILFTLGLGFFTLYRIFAYDPNIFTNVITLYASLCGGGLTLGGVAWTIKNQETTKQKENKMAFKPFVNISNKTNKSLLFSIDENQNKSIDFKSHNEIIDIKKELGFDFYKIDDIYIKNSNNSNIIVDKIIINENVINISCYNFIEKGQVFHIKLLNYIYAKEFNMVISILDTIGNEYLFQLFFDRKYNDVSFKLDDHTSKQIPIYTYTANSIEEIK